ncbi:hypothetical protein U1Q18_044798 [Sarracenia purpurea var. burkii]
MSANTATATQNQQVVSELVTKLGRESALELLKVAHRLQGKPTVYFSTDPLDICIAVVRSGIPDGKETDDELLDLVIDSPAVDYCGTLLVDKGSTPWFEHSTQAYQLSDEFPRL